MDRDPPSATADEMIVRPVSSASDWEHARHIRRNVFIAEQSCTEEEEFDSLDASCRHLLGWLEDQAVATARWHVVRKHGTAFAKLERFAVLKAFRGRGLGRALVDETIRDARRAGFERMLIHAQQHLEGFYATFGFSSRGAVFIEAGIPHVRMELTYHRN